MAHMAHISRISVKRAGMILFFLAASTACEHIVSEADTKVSNMKCEPDVGVIRGELDAGVKVSFTIMNQGNRGAVRVTASISTSEGEWSRRQDLTLGANQRRRLEYFFQEPTVNATNIQCNVKSFP